MKVTTAYYLDSDGDNTKPGQSLRMSPPMAMSPTAQTATTETSMSIPHPRGLRGIAMTGQQH